MELHFSQHGPFKFFQSSSTYFSLLSLTGSIVFQWSKYSFYPPSAKVLNVSERNILLIRAWRRFPEKFFYRILYFLVDEVRLIQVKHLLIVEPVCRRRGTSLADDDRR